MPTGLTAYQFGFAIANALSSTKQAAAPNMLSMQRPQSGRTAQSATPTNNFRVERRPQSMLSAAGPALQAAARPTMTQMPPRPAASKPAPRYGIIDDRLPSNGSPNPGSQNQAPPVSSANRAAAVGMPIPQPGPSQIDVGAMEMPEPAYRPGPELSKMIPEQGMMDYMGPAPTVRDTNKALGYENYKARLQDQANLRAYHAGTYKGQWEGNDMRTPAPSPSPLGFAARAARPNAF